MSYPFSTFTIESPVESTQEALEGYLLESALVDLEQLTLAKKIQARQEGPLLMVLLQLSFIDLQQFNRLLDWNVSSKFLAANQSEQTADRYAQAAEWREWPEAAIG
ncbi:DUF2949 domain-containing protein [Pseudanabaena sp. PCC 6802]|uniref:DUF2949 domain-containing protein n=1 Tax=Pseudanabaena sp. PCC 6802 TaxID=118173 RepID=UPI000370BC66|nr:DUF2949 domain-containing protein [Pseudanabaena sp. PCC 6802]